MGLLNIGSRLTGNNAPIQKKRYYDDDCNFISSFIQLNKRKEKIELTGKHKEPEERKIKKDVQKKKKEEEKNY
jgi:hypothetical protein